jgi:tetratricopeptide (TPR) repeat protein
LLQLEHPDDLAYFPLAGRRLRSDLETATADLKRIALSETPAAYRASLNLAVILSALGRDADADDAATRAILMSPYSHVAFLIRGRVRLAARQLPAARADVATGLAIQPDDAELIALRGRVSLAENDTSRALSDFDHAIALGSPDSVHAMKAKVLSMLGRDQEAINQWSLALRRDPGLSELFLGRARSYVALARWDDALVDLDHALSWSHGDTRTELAIAWTYLRCLPARPDHFKRWFDLIERITEHSRPAHSAPTGPRAP